MSVTSAEKPSDLKRSLTVATLLVEVFAKVGEWPPCRMEGRGETVESEDEEGSPQSFASQEGTMVVLAKTVPTGGLVPCPPVSCSGPL